MDEQPRLQQFTAFTTGDAGFDKPKTERGPIDGYFALEKRRVKALEKIAEQLERLDPKG